MNKVVLCGSLVIQWHGQGSCFVIMHKNRHILLSHTNVPDMALWLLTPTVFSNAAPPASRHLFAGPHSYTALNRHFMRCLHTVPLGYVAEHSPQSSSATPIGRVCAWAKVNNQEVKERATWKEGLHCHVTDSMHCLHFGSKGVNSCSCWRLSEDQNMGRLHACCAKSYISP